MFIGFPMKYKFMKIFVEDILENISKILKIIAMNFWYILR